MVFTNIKIPRSEFPQRGPEFYQKTLVKKSASIGANATIVCGVTIGRYAMDLVLVTKDIPPLSKLLAMLKLLGKLIAKVIEYDFFRCAIHSMKLTLIFF